MPPAQARSAAAELEKHVRYLASEKLTGRGVDTPGIKLARDYIAAEFAKHGLRPGGDGGSYFQGFEVAVGVTVKEPSHFRLAESQLARSEQWVPLGLSASNKVESELVFAGYGITVKDYGYDDYAGVDVNGKIAVVLRYEPPPKDAGSPFKKYPEYSVHSALRTKANNARDHGAIGMILVDMNRPGDNQELLSTRSSLWRGGRNLVAVQVKRGVMESRLAALGISLSALKKKIDGGEKPASMPLTGLRATLQVTLEEVHERAENVVAVLPGADASLGQENIVVGAHYDHLGFGHFGVRDSGAAGTIHSGADDNASGVAVLLRLAQPFGQLSPKPSPSVIFVAFSAEELGLHGSRHFVEQAPATSSTQAMINLDMVGRLRGDRLTVFGTRSGDKLSGILATAADRLGLSASESDDVGRSDHLSFYDKKIPVLHFFTGTHEHYHRASDTWEKLNYEGMARVSELVMACALQLADTRESINFVSLPSRPPRETHATRQSSKTYLGNIPH